ncbi:hypothetical protein DLAC_07579 [Tieghemostelium lacteum]|uniref:Major facilitator superfamily (MFS) profile domain-containing protein n=1 Tax=Tieghemostelium lacteum TaxID=361077 RepID=A0A151ZD31_TIELA|nr:hypothetical protein DLAC_07579 [Tieghemostelium lacteum]|eukprot:KYQ91784.1 hypothetical protein DLAC_07579 [Tieghemostelium lacteum]
MESPSDNTLSDTSEQVMKNSEVNSESSSIGDNDRLVIKSNIFIASLYYIKISLWFFGYSIISGATASILIPYQVLAMVGDGPKEYWNGIVPIGGMFINLVATPIFGYLSDCTKTPFGKRRPYLFIGSLIMLIFLCASATFTIGDSIGGFIGVLIGYHFGQGIAGGAFSGIIPDIVHPSQAGIASGWLGVAYSLGTLIGTLVGGALATNLWYAYGFVIAIFGFLSMMSVILLREDQFDEWTMTGTVVGFFKSLYLPYKTYYNFYWVLITRFFNTMGVYMVLSYLFYFSANIIGKAEIFVASIILAVVIVFSIPSSILGGYLADFYNTKLLVYISSSIQVIAMSLFIVLCFYPSYAGLLVLAGFFGTGYGAYQCVDWALALHSLPSKTIGKDMGIWHISFIAPTVIAPAITGGILNSFKTAQGLPIGYAVVFAIATMWFLLSTIFIFPMKLSAISFKSRQAKEAQMKELEMNNTNTTTTEIKSTGGSV